MTPDRSLGRRLRDARTSAGLSQTDLERASGIPKATLSRYENDRIMPSLPTLRRLAEALGVAESMLLSGRRTPQEELYAALRDEGVEIRSKADAERIAGVVADIERPERRRGRG